MSVQGERHELAPRTANPPAFLVRHCCLDCSKLLGTLPDLPCVLKQGALKCNGCTVGGLSCEPIPQTMIHQANKLMAAADAHVKKYKNSKSAAARASLALLVTQQDAFTTRVDRAVRT